jgi:hypothetical protein
LRRAARLGDGWIGVPHNPDEAAGMVKKLLGYRAQGPLAGQPLDITIMTMDSPAPADIARFEAAGVTRLVISPFTRTSEAAAGLEKFAKTVMRAA